MSELRYSFKVWNIRQTGLGKEAKWGWETVERRGGSFKVIGCGTVRGDEGAAKVAASAALQKYLVSRTVDLRKIVGARR